jgi:aryl-alcohol dehydrogenase-like predicted oxidoreductase
MVVGPTACKGPAGRWSRKAGLPYDPDAPVAAQIEQSLASSLQHLGTTVIDSYLLHGASQRAGLAPADRTRWVRTGCLAALRD